MDHLVYAAPDLDPAVSRVEELLGVESVPGGRHPGAGTRNALLSFGGDRYLEIVAPDPAQPDPPHPRWFGIDELEAPRLATWCVRTGSLDEVVERARAAGIELGSVNGGGRRKPDGSAVRWRVTDPSADRLGGVFPFFIDWLGSAHPGSGEGQGCRVLELRARHPRPADVRRGLEALEPHLSLTPVVSHGPVPALVAVLETPRGVVELS